MSEPTDEAKGKITTVNRRTLLTASHLPSRGEAGEAAPVSAEARALCDKLFDTPTHPPGCIACLRIQFALTSYAESQQRYLSKQIDHLADYILEAFPEHPAWADQQGACDLAVKLLADLRAQVERLTADNADLRHEWNLALKRDGSGLEALRRYVELLKQAEAERDTALKSLAEQRALVDKLVEALKKAAEFTAGFPLAVASLPSAVSEADRTAANDVYESAIAALAEAAALLKERG